MTSIASQRHQQRQFSILLLLLLQSSITHGFVPATRRIAKLIRNDYRTKYGVRGCRMQLTSSGDATDEDKFDAFLSQTNLRAATNQLSSNPTLSLTQNRFLSIFNTIEERTADPSETQIQPNPNQFYPAVSPARAEMTNMYATLQQCGHLKLFGAASDGNVLAGGSKIVTPKLLEEITELSMSELTPKPTDNLLIAGVGLAFVEAMISAYFGIDYVVLAFSTIFASLLDRLFANGAVFESFQKIVMPSYGEKVLKHEAGHFLIAYLLGCPVEGCVLSPIAALKDPRFGGSVTAGTSFFDKDLSEQVNGQRPLSRQSIDRFSMIVMAGIAAEAIEFGQADGGAGDEMTLVTFLSKVSPRGGGASAWNVESIKNQARWGALQSVLLLKEYKVCYDALVDALERGGNLGECIYAIEKAARDNNVEIRTEPKGIILDKDPYGEWVMDAMVVKEEENAFVRK